MDIDEVKKFVIENKKGLIVGAVVALLIRSLVR